MNDRNKLAMASLSGVRRDLAADIRMLAMQQSKTINAIIQEALDDYVAKHAGIAKAIERAKSL